MAKVSAVATNTMTVHAKAVRSAVAMKMLMAVTGLYLVLFLLMHMWGNLKMFLGPEAFNHYAEWLKSDLLYPIVPHGWFIWIFRFSLVAAIGLHMWSALVLTGRSHAGRGRYQRTDRRAQTYSARTMGWGGVILALMLLFHIGQFTVRAIQTGFNASTAPYDMVVASFSPQYWWVFVLYALWMVAVCMHIRHGFWSAFTTLGMNTSAQARKVLNGLGILVALLLYFGFMIMPVSVLVGLVK